MFLRVVKGPLIGQHFQIKEGARVGRSSGDIIITDPKISSTHAQIELNQKGEFCFVDLNSGNGTWLDEQRVKRVVLMPGVQFRIGQTVLEVISDAVPAAASSNAQSEILSGWRARLAEGVSELIAENPEPTAIAAFKPAVVVEFVGGNHTGEKRLLGYGPRRFGSKSLDMEILDSGVPSLAFEITPEDGAAIFVSHNKNLIEVNGKLVATSPLRSGDIIGIGKTKIKVSFL